MAGVKGQRSGGHNKRSARTHVIRGTFRSDRHGDEAEAAAPPAPPGRPEPPKPLEGDALEEWTRMVGRLERCGTLAIVDDAVLYQYARLFLETEQLAVMREEVTAAVQILEENIGDLKDADLVAAFQEITKMRRLESGYATQIRQGRMAIRQYLVEFGQTPAARARVKSAGTQKPQSKVEAFRSRKA